MSITIPLTLSTFCWLIAALFVVDAFRRAYREVGGIAEGYFNDLAVFACLLGIAFFGLFGWVLRLHGL